MNNVKDNYKDFQGQGFEQCQGLGQRFEQCQGQGQRFEQCQGERQGQNEKTKPIRYLKQSEQLKYSFSQ